MVQLTSGCGNFWMQGNCLAKSLLHFCNSISAFLPCFLSACWKPHQPELNHKPQQMLRRSEPLLLYLGGRQLIAALSLGSLWVTVNQHPLEFKLKGDVKVTTIIALYLHFQT